MKRSYHLKRRADSQSRTRQKIVDATIELHQAKGLKATTMNDIAERAQVGKVTVYRHFPDDESLVQACSGQYFQRHPFPDLEDWRAIDDASERLRRGLNDTYDYHEATAPMMTRVLAEARHLPIMEPYHTYWKRAADVLAAGWSVAGRRRTLLKSGLALAVSFDTWRTLVQEQQLTNAQAIELMMKLIRDQ
jgi:AcrR family transcriptional regulator